MTEQLIHTDEADSAIKILRALVGQLIGGQSAGQVQSAILSGDWPFSETEAAMRLQIKMLNALERKDNPSTNT